MMRRGYREGKKVLNKHILKWHEIVGATPIAAGVAAPPLNRYRGEWRLDQVIAGAIGGALANSIDERPTMTDAIVRDSNGTPLNDGDSVTLIKDLKVKGTSETIKRGTLVKNIRLNGNPGEIECNTKQVKGLVLKTEFLKKA